MMIYADNAATTKVSRTAIEAMIPCLEEQYGNPSSLYSLGQRAKEILEEARAKIAAAIGAEPAEITFTSGGSEADNQAIRSAAMIGKKKGKTHIISTAFEHHAVLHTLAALEKEGFTYTLLDVHEDGLVRPEELEAAIRDDTCLVTIMYANNEIGTIQPITELGAICKKHGILFHTDAVQAVGHLPINVKEQNIDMLSSSAHKYHGPKVFRPVKIRFFGLYHIPGQIMLIDGLVSALVHIGAPFSFKTGFRNKQADKTQRNLIIYFPAVGCPAGTDPEVFRSVIPDKIDAV